VLIAALGGAAVGMEREHSGHARGRLGGLRTFTMIGLVAGMAGLLWRTELQLLGAMLLTGVLALIVASYVAASRRDIEATTEMAALVVVGGGLMAGLGWWGLSSAVAAISTLLLAEKSQLHGWVGRMPDEGLRAGFRFAVMALVVLPLLPEGPYGPLGGVRPRELWLLVLLISGLSFAGYVARFVAGAGHGYVVTGILGGLVSSTSTTLSLARTSVSEPGSSQALALGVIAACTVMYARVMTVVAVLNAPLFSVLVPYLGPVLLVGIGISVWGWWCAATNEQEGSFPRNPLEVMPALKLAVLFQLMLFGIELVRGAWGEAGMVATGAVLGFTEVDAMTVSMARSGGEPRTAALAIAAGCMANTVFKMAVAVVVGRGEFRRRAAMWFAGLLMASIVGVALRY
jgi:uncharacterized membrane protein (DUF4010 family)